MPQEYDGTVVQSANNFDVGNYTHQKLYMPVLGVILNVYHSDHPTNRSSVQKQDQRGSACEAQVLILNDGLDTPWIVQNALVLPNGSSGVDNYHEEIPRGCSMMSDGSKYNADMVGIDVEKLDGDWCIVQFIGGSIDQPIITSWFPHNGNRSDPATSGLSGDNVLVQGRRLFKRFQGTKITLTDKGSIFVDTSEAGSVMKGGASGWKRNNVEIGGSVQLDVKDSQQVEVNFNAPVPIQTEPSLNQKNPHGTFPVRDDVNSRVTLDKATIQLLAKEVVTLMSKEGTLDILAEKAAKIVSNTADVTVQAATKVDVDAPSVNLGDGTLTAAVNGVVVSSGVDSFTGSTYYALSNASSAVLAKK